MRRGDLVTVAMSGDFGKPRPALVIQSDRFEETGTVAVASARLPPDQLNSRTPLVLRSP